MIKCSRVCFSRKMGLERDLNVEPDFTSWRDGGPALTGEEGWKVGSWTLLWGHPWEWEQPEMNAVLGAETLFPE